MPLPAQLQESDLLLFRKLDSGALIDAKCATLSLHSRMDALDFKPRSLIPLSIPTFQPHANPETCRKI
jgi:hypothetical protein